MNFILILINCYNCTGNYPDERLDIFMSNYPVEIVSTFCADSAHWRFYNKKRLIKNTLFISRVNSNVLAKQISSLVNSRLER